jgi:L-rhamnose mutarotase
MFTLGLAMKLRPGAYDAYKLAHDQLWPELAQGMRDNQVSMAIYRDGDQLFLPQPQPTSIGSEAGKIRSWHAGTKK